MVVYRKRKYGASVESQRVSKKGRVVSLYNNVYTAPAPRRVELKYDDGDLSGAISSTPAVVLLSTIAIGTDANQRIGRRIQYHNIEVSWVWRWSANHGGPNHARFMIVFDSAPNGALPAYTDILHNSSVQTLVKADTRSRFTVLLDSMCTSAVNDPVGTGNMSWENFRGHKLISLAGKHAQYIGTDATIASMEKGAIYLVTNSYQNNVDALDFTNRIQFSDS